MQRKKNIKLLIILVLLIGANVALIWFKPQAASGFDDPYKFTMTDTTGVDLIEISRADEQIRLSKTASGWLVNDTYPADDRMIGLVFAVMTSVEVQRELSSDASVLMDGQQSSSKVAIKRGGENLIDFQASGNSTKTSSYFIDGENKSYVVNIPGYTSYVSGIFDLTESDWRNKQVFSSTWASLKSLRLKAAENDNDLLSINYLDNFYRVDGVPQVDTTVMMDYLQQTTEMIVSQYIGEGEYPEYDSLSQTTPAFVLTVEDFDEQKNAFINIYPQLSGDRRRLIKIFPAEELAIVGPNVIQDALKSSDNFRGDK